MPQGAERFLAPMCARSDSSGRYRYACATNGIAGHFHLNPRRANGAVRRYPLVATAKTTDDAMGALAAVTHAWTHTQEVTPA